MGLFKKTRGEKFVSTMTSKNVQAAVATIVIGGAAFPLARWTYNTVTGLVGIGAQKVKAAFTRAPADPAAYPSASHG